MKTVSSNFGGSGFGGGGHDWGLCDRMNSKVDYDLANEKHGSSSGGSGGSGCGNTFWVLLGIIIVGRHH